MFAYAVMAPPSEPVVKLTPLPRDDYNAVVTLAKASGQTPSEWLLDVVLGVLAKARDEELTRSIIKAGA